MKKAKDAVPVTWSNSILRGSKTFAQPTNEHFQVDCVLISLSSRKTSTFKMYVFILGQNEPKLSCIIMEEKEKLDPVCGC